MTTAIAIAIALAATGACGDHRAGGASSGDKADMSESPRIKLSPVAKAALCATKGEARIGERVTQPTARAFARDTSGDAAALTFVYRGATEHERALASGDDRRQLGLKLRAANGCNLVYVMWRLDPRPQLDISVKYNPGMTTHENCGASGYKKVTRAEHGSVPRLVIGERHTLRAEIDGDELTVWIDERPAWRGTLPGQARRLSGPAGLRSDNLAFDLVAFSAAPGTTNTRSIERRCRAADSE